MEPIRFTFDNPDHHGKRLVSAFHGDDVLGQERFDVFQSWQAKPFLEKVTGALPATAGYESWEDAVAYVRGDFDEAVRTLDDATAPAPAPASRETISAKPFPAHVLPGAVGEFVREAAAAIGCDVSFVALPMLACLARAIGNNRTIKLKRTWTEPAIIWAAIVGKSGTHKSPALAAATAPLNRKQAEAQERFQEELKLFEVQSNLYERSLAQWKRTKSDEPPPWEPEEPALQRYIVSDITIEALADRLHRQFDGVLVVRDELSGWLGGIAEYKGGQGSDLGHWLASWSAVPLIVDRKTGAIKTVHVPRAAVNIVGGIQPGVLRSAIGREHMQDGLCARLLLAMPEPKPIRWTEATVSPATEAALEKVFDRLLALEPAADGDGKPAPFAMPLSEQAKAAWVEYFNRHRAELADLDDDLAAAWSKLEAYAARFALIFQLCANAAGEANDDAVDEESIKAGIELADWFGNEAKRVYGVLAETEQDREQRELVDLVRRKGGTVTARELMRSSRRYPVSDDAEAALDSLTKAGYGRWHFDDHAGGRGQPTRHFTLVDSVDNDTNSLNAEANGNTVNVNGVSVPNVYGANRRNVDGLQ